MLIACHYWDPKSPKLFSPKHINEFKNLKIIGDITCDINGSIPTTIRSTTIENPYYSIDVNSMKEIDLEKRNLTMSMDMRYLGQNWELTVNLKTPPRSPTEMEEAKKEFIRLHQQTYGHSSEEDPIEVVNFRVEAFATTGGLKVHQIIRGSHDPSTACTGSRKIYSKETDNLIENSKKKLSEKKSKVENS